MSTKSGLRWGVFGGAKLGVILPPSTLGSAVALRAVGAATGKARELHHRVELADRLDGTIAPGHSGIIALVFDPPAVEIRNAPARARGAGRPHQVRGRVLGASSPADQIASAKSLRTPARSRRPNSTP